MPNKIIFFDLILIDMVGFLCLALGILFLDVGPKSFSKLGSVWILLETSFNSIFTSENEL
jgi:hypothetical protein